MSRLSEHLPSRDPWEEAGQAARWPEPFAWHHLASLDRAAHGPSPLMARMIERDLEEMRRP